MAGVWNGRRARRNMMAFPLLSPLAQNKSFIRWTHSSRPDVMLLMQEEFDLLVAVALAAAMLNGGSRA